MVTSGLTHIAPAPLHPLIITPSWKGKKQNWKTRIGWICLLIRNSKKCLTFLATSCLCFNYFFFPTDGLSLATQPITPPSSLTRIHTHTTLVSFFEKLLWYLFFFTRNSGILNESMHPQKKYWWFHFTSNCLLFHFFISFFSPLLIIISPSRFTTA